MERANGIIRANGGMRRKMMAMRLRRWVAAVLMLGMLAALHAAFAASGAWDQPAGALAEQIAALMGPGQARLTLRNASSIGNDELPGIRKLLVAGFEGAGRDDGGRGERERDSRDAERECARAAVGGRGDRRQRDAGGDGACGAECAARGCGDGRRDAAQPGRFSVRASRCWRLRRRRMD